MVTISELVQMSLSESLNKEDVYSLLILFRTKKYLALDDLNNNLQNTALSLSKKGIITREGNLLMRDNEKLMDLFIRL